MTKSEYKYSVCVKCLTYNHSPYIKDTLNGFTMQHTGFPYVCMVVDDASTDGESDVIQEYIESHFDMNSLSKEETDDYVLQFVQHKNNKNCFFAVYYLKYNHWGKKPKAPYFLRWEDSSKYSAICEGDDYWIDENKLQKQVYFLDSHPDYTMCYGRCLYYYQKSCKMSKRAFGGRSTQFDEFLLGNPVPTPTVLFRMDLYKKYLSLFGDREKYWAMSDFSKWLFFAHEGKIQFVEDVMAVYRVLPNSASHNLDETKSEKFVYSTYEIVRFFTDYYNVPNLYDDNKLKIALFTHAFRFGNRDKCVARFKEIINPSLKLRIKFLIIRNRLLFNILKGHLFYCHI